MNNHSKLRPYGDSPDMTTDNNESNHKESIFGIPNMFNSANFAQASILSNDAESTINSPNLADTSIFSDVPSSTNNSPVSAQTSIFSGGQNSNVTSPVTAQTSIFGNASNSNLTSQTSAQVNDFPNAPNCTITTSNAIQHVTRIQEVDPSAHDSEPEPEQDSEPGIDLDIELDDNPDLEITSDIGSRSTSSSPEAPDFDAPAAPAPENLFLSSDHNSPLIFKCNMPRTFTGFGVMFNSTKRSAAIKGQAQRIGAGGADKDDSGTYDPSLERKRNIRNTRAKKNKENDGEEGTAKIGVATRNGRKTKEQGSFEWIITFKLTSEKGLKYLKEITPGPEGDERNFPPIYEADYNDSGDENENEDDEIDYSIHSTRRKRIKISHNRRSDGLTLEELHDGHPQRRGCKVCFEAGDDECSLIEYNHEWPCEGCEDAGIDCEFIIPPVLKLSCIRCKEKLRKRCSYADDGGKGVESCKACKEASVKCIAGPRAGSAPSMRISDVLANAGTRRKASMHTKAEGIKKGPETATATSVTKPQAMPRKYVSCNRCRIEFKGRCSLKRDDEGPCNRCVKANVACTFTMLPSIITTPSKEKGKGIGTGKYMAPVSRAPQDLTQTIILESTKLNDRVWRITHPHAHRTEGQQKAFARAQSSCSPDIQFLSSNPIKHPNYQMTKRNTPSYIPNTPTQQTIPPTFTLHYKGIRTITVTTSFSHPLIFNYKRDPMSFHPPCDFHTNPFFGLFGYGPRLVTVVPWPSITGAGYQELENGWGDSDAGQEVTRMCVKCTYARVRILGCAEHGLRPMEGLDERMRDEGLVRDSVEACEEGLREGRWGRGTGGEPEVGSCAELVWRVKWCAVCPRPGDWVCRFSVGGGGEEGGKGLREGSMRSLGSQSRVNRGCGLILCDTCYELHGKVQKGGKKSGRVVLGRVIQLAGEMNRREDYPDGVRADAGFLREDGELFVRMLKGGCVHGENNGMGGKARFLSGRMEMKREFNTVDSRGMSYSDANYTGEREDNGKGKETSRAATPFSSSIPSRQNPTPTKNPKQKEKPTHPPQPRQTTRAHPTTASKHEAPRSEIRLARNSGNSITTTTTNYQSGTIIHRHGDIRGETLSGRVGMLGNQMLRRNEMIARTHNQARINDFDIAGDHQGRGISGGRWKGKGVDGDEVMRNIEREVIELSD